MQDFTKLIVWEKAHQLVLGVYRATENFPRDERFGITAQLRRAACSVAANLAEGCGRRGAAELARFADIAMGSASEVEYYLLLARDLRLLPPASWSLLAKDTSEVKRMLAGFIESLRRSAERRGRPSLP